MSFLYIPTDIKYKGNNVFYKKNITPNIHRAVEFNDNYEYFFKPTDKEEFVPLGKFIEKTIFYGTCIWDDRSFPILVFEKHNKIFENDTDKIYAQVIPNNWSNMTCISEMTLTKYNNEYPLYYEKTE
jgi:hypothetical protein